MECRLIPRDQKQGLLFLKHLILDTIESLLSYSSLVLSFHLNDIEKKKRTNENCKKTDQIILVSNNEQVLVDMENDRTKLETVPILNTLRCNFKMFLNECKLSSNCAIYNV